MLPLTLTHIHSKTNTHKHNEPNANKQFHSALPRPDNGWRVWGVKSNETGREQQLSVCGNGVGGGGGGRGLSQDTSVLVKAESKPERESSSDRNNEHQNGCQLKLQKKRQLYSLSVNHCCRSSLVDWCELMRDPPGGQEGRLDSNKPG